MSFDTSCFEGKLDNFKIKKYPISGNYGNRDLEVPPRFELGNRGFADPCLTTWLWYHMMKGVHTVLLSVWSGWRGSNSLPPPWQGGALPDELHPQMVPPVGIEPTTRGFSVPCSTNWATEAYFKLSGLLSLKCWRPGSGSNRRPLAWQASVLTNWTTGPYCMVGTTGLEPVTPCL